MSYIGAEPTTAAFPFDQFSGNGTTTAFTLTYAPASTTSIIVAISGVVQNPNLYSVIGTTITFSPAPPTGTNNISVLYLGLPVIGVSNPGNTAYFSSTSFTATGGQTTFTPSGSYTPGFINVIRNGAQLAPANYTATNGTTVTLANACTAGDIVVIEVFTLTSISNALPLTGGTVTGASTFNSGITFGAGTTTVAPIDLTAGTNLTTAIAGAIEYDGRVFYATPQGTQRGVVPGAQFFRLNSGVVGANVSTAQSVFGVGVTLSADTVYAFEGFYVLSKTAGTTSHSVGLGFGGSATVNNIIWTFSGYDSASTTSVNTSQDSGYVTSVSNTTVSRANTSATMFNWKLVRGTVSVNAGGTFIPQYTLSAAPGGAYTTAAGSYFMIYPIGASGANTSVGTWA
jgi:hypothetical protein